MTKQIEIKTAYHSILGDIEWESLVNGYFCSSNLLANYLNDYSVQEINAFIAGFLQDNIKHLDKLDIECILYNPDYIIQSAANEFYDALNAVIDNSERTEWVLRNANHHFEWGNYYIYANADIASLYIIRAANECDAYDELVTRFESAFEIDESDVENVDDQQFNDNGTPINIDYLVLLGEIKFKKK